MWAGRSGWQSQVCHMTATRWKGAGASLWLLCSIFTTSGPSDPCPAPDWLPGHGYRKAGCLISQRGAGGILLSFWDLHKSDFKCFRRDSLCPAVFLDFSPWSRPLHSGLLMLVSVPPQCLRGGFPVKPLSIHSLTL